VRISIIIAGKMQASALPGRAGISRRPIVRGRLILLACAAAIFAGGMMVPSPAPGAGQPGLKSAPQAGTTRANRRVVIVVIDRIGLDDITGSTAPNLNRLIGGGSTSLMNARIKYDQYGQGSYVVIGAGGRALGGYNSGLAYNGDESLKAEGGYPMKAEDIYFARTGRRAPPGSVVNLFIEEMKKESDVNLATSTPGLLGQALREGKRKVSVLGNADSQLPAVFGVAGYQADGPYTNGLTGETADIFRMVTPVHREVSCVAMDEQGVVPGGDVSDDLLKRTPVGAGVSTDFKRLVEEAEAESDADLLVIDMGQTSRVDEQADYFTDRSLEIARKKAVLECDAALGKILSGLDLSRDLMIVCTPTPTRKMIADGDLLTPLIITGAGFEPGSHLSSPTTRREGLVSNFDIAPTIIEFLGLKAPAEMEGRKLSSTGPGKNLESLVVLRDRAVASFQSRRIMVRIFIIYAIVILVLYLLFVLVREDLVRRYQFSWSLVIMLALAAPLAYLILPVFRVSQLYAQILIAVGLALLLSIAALVICRRKGETVGGFGGAGTLRPLLYMSGATLFLVLLDPILGSPLMTFSPFGSDVILGDRYYGIGNLYMGVAVGAALLFAGLVLQVFPAVFDKPWKRYSLAGAVFLLTALILGYPRLGANVGGLITAVVASLVMLMKLEGKRIGWKKVAVLVLVLVAVVGILLVVDLVLPGPSSHAGRALTKIKGEGFSGVASTIGRKIAASWTLATNSIWRILFLLAIVAGVLLQWRFKLFRRVLEALPHLYASLAGMAVGTVIALLFNDSGIEPASMIAVFLLFPCMLLLAGRGHGKRSGLES